MSKYFAEITGWGKCLPPATLTNDDLSTFMETSDEWIRSRTGIGARRISHVDTSDLATVAAKRAIACAGIEAKDLDIIIIATCSPDSLIPNIASKVQQNLGAGKAAAFDLNAACTGFVYGLETATRLIQAGSYKHALVVGAEHLSFFIDWAARDTAVLFGDGAGAAVLSRTENQVGLQQAQLGCDSDGRDILAVPKFGTCMERFAADNGYFDFNFEGRDIFKRAVKGMGTAAKTVLVRAGMDVKDIDIMIPHQANIRIIQTLADLAGIGEEKAFVNIEKYGNTSAATVPIAICEAVEQGRVKPGDNILLAAFGAGLTWGAGLLKWGDRVTPINSSDAELPECTQTALELIEENKQRCLNKPEK